VPQIPGLFTLETVLLQAKASAPCIHHDPVECSPIKPNTPTGQFDPPNRCMRRISTADIKAMRKGWLCGVIGSLACSCTVPAYGDTDDGKRGIKAVVKDKENKSWLVHGWLAWITCGLLASAAARLRGSHAAAGPVPWDDAHACRQKIRFKDYLRGI
jgi:hypothetical protein